MKFNSLSNKRKDALRREYKRDYLDSYNYSIRLFIGYTIFGILSVIGLVLIPINSNLGYILFVINFIFMIITLYFLNLSNNSFKRFLKKKGYEWS